MVLFIHPFVCLSVRPLQLRNVASLTTSISTNGFLGKFYPISVQQKLVVLDDNLKDVNGLKNEYHIKNKDEPKNYIDMYCVMS